MWRLQQVYLQELFIRVDVVGGGVELAQCPFNARIEVLPVTYNIRRNGVFIAAQQNNSSAPCPSHSETNWASSQALKHVSGCSCHSRSVAGW